MGFFSRTFWIMIAVSAFALADTPPDFTKVGAAIKSEENGYFSTTKFNFGALSFISDFSFSAGGSPSLPIYSSNARRYVDQNDIRFKMVDISVQEEARIRIIQSKLENFSAPERKHYVFRILKKCARDIGASFVESDVVEADVTLGENIWNSYVWRGSKVTAGSSNAESFFFATTCVVHALPLPKQEVVLFVESSVPATFFPATSELHQPLLRLHEKILFPSFESDLKGILSTVSFSK